MKKIVFPFMALCLLSSCAQEDADFQLNESKSIQRSEKRTVADAVDIANSMVNCEIKSVTRSGRSASVLSVTPVVVSTTRSTSDTVMYAVDYSNNQGFALIATDKSLVPVLAVVDEGSYGDLSEEGNENYQIALEAVKAYASSKVTPLVPEPSPTIPATWYEYSDTIFPRAKRSPNVEIQLKQYWPENMYCPNGYAGCGPVAALHILSFLEAPSAVTYTFDGSDIQSEELDWENLKKHKISDLGISPSQSLIDDHYNSCDLNAEGHKTIGRLIREIGNRTNPEYDSIGTATSVLSTINLISSLSGRACKSHSTNVEDLYQNLCSNPEGAAYVYAYGLDEKNKNAPHGWVADAIWETGLKVRYFYYEYVPGQEDPNLMCYTNDKIAKYIHYNWGSGGVCNGYFLIDVFNPNDAYEYDNSDIYNKFIVDISFEYDFRYYLFTK